jgi:hypothetical protein
MQALFDQWATLKAQTQQTLSTTGSVRERAHKELQILKSLSDAGCVTIPGENLDVRFLIQDREPTLRDMDARLSRL